MPRPAPFYAALHAALIAAGLGWASGGFAQVLRCTAADGKVTYTNSPCPAHTQALEIEAAKTPEELAAQRQRDAQAQALRQQRQQARLHALQERRAKAEIEALQAISQSTRHTEPDYTASAACRAAQRRVQEATPRDGRYSQEDRQALEQAQDAADRACLGPEGYAQVQRQRAIARHTRPAVPPSPPIVLLPVPPSWPLPPWHPDPWPHPPPSYGLPPAMPPQVQPHAPLLAPPIAAPIAPPTGLSPKPPRQTPRPVDAGLAPILPPPRPPALHPASPASSQAPELEEGFPKERKAP